MPKNDTKVQKFPMNPACNIFFINSLGNHLKNPRKMSKNGNKNLSKCHFLTNFGKNFGQKKIVKMPFFDKFWAKKNCQNAIF